MRDAQRRLFDNRVSRALQLKAIAPEYYETLAYHTSWTWVTWKFLSDPEVGPWTRMRRPTREAAPAPATPDKAAALVRLLPSPANPGPVHACHHEVQARTCPCSAMKPSDGNV